MDPQVSTELQAVGFEFVMMYYNMRQNSSAGLKNLYNGGSTFRYGQMMKELKGLKIMPQILAYEFENCVTYMYQHNITSVAWNRVSIQVVGAIICRQTGIYNYFHQTFKVKLVRSQQKVLINDDNTRFIDETELYQHLGVVGLSSDLTDAQFCTAQPRFQASNTTGFGTAVTAEADPTATLAETHTDVNNKDFGTAVHTATPSEAALAEARYNHLDKSVTDAPIEQRVANDFMVLYYTLRHMDVYNFHRLFDRQSLYTYGPGETYKGQQDIHDQVVKLNFEGKVSNILECKSSMCENGDITLKVIGQLAVASGKVEECFLQDFKIRKKSVGKYVIAEDSTHFVSSQEFSQKMQLLTQAASSPSHPA